MKPELDKYIAMNEPYIDDDIETILSMDARDVAKILDGIKMRELTATGQLKDMKRKIKTEINQRETMLDEAIDARLTGLIDDIIEDIKLLKRLL